MKNSFLSNNSIIFQLFSLSMVISDTLYIAYFAEMRFSREMDRDCCWNLGHSRRTQTARKQSSPWICVARTRDGNHRMHPQHPRLVRWRARCPNHSACRYTEKSLVALIGILEKKNGQIRIF
ncbi:hypothetical protein ALC57_09359 [Trachymyrmex cornetzi]|uniref:Uncharacterized protein n=1 Tax=Trachymyrmex cornetzi TaxID=471704 RepID=A0A195DZF2_9HYME|nr:hypothetical protein ALC57_09359 [Trachymyrmex cornetzi]